MNLMTTFALLASSLFAAGVAALFKLRSEAPRATFFSSSVAQCVMPLVGRAESSDPT